MQIYKLFSKESRDKKFHFSKIDAPLIVGNSEHAFGLKIEPERYREFLNSISKYLLKNKIRQHIMTDYKFTQLIHQSNSLGFNLTDITFQNEISYRNDEIIKDVKEALWSSNISLILELVNEALENGHKIFSITGNIQRHSLEQIKIYANGTISIENTVVDREVYPIIDYLIKGPEVLS